jgi:hypothetical protein
MKIFLQQSEGATDYGDSVLANMFQNLVLENGILAQEYKEIAEEDNADKHIIRETPISNGIKLLCKVYGWKEFLEGLVLFAKNQEQQSKDFGLEDASKPWHKIANVVSALPKNPMI